MEERVRGFVLILAEMAAFLQGDRNLLPRLGFFRNKIELNHAGATSCLLLFYNCNSAVVSTSAGAGSLIIDYRPLQKSK